MHFQVAADSLTQSIEQLGFCWWSRQEFPSALALERAWRKAFLSCGPQEVATCITEAAFERVIGPRQTRHVITVEQAGPITPAHLVEVPSKSR